LHQIGAILPFSSKEIEITLEANPESLTQEKANAYAKIGINRLSIGVQSLDDALLHTLGRTHHAKKAIHAIENAAAGGIENISIDLMYEIPGQTAASWKSSLAQVAQLPITHLSLYNLTIEPGTLFFKYREKLLKEVAAPHICAEMYHGAIDQLHAIGLEQYEISAFARPGFPSRHNTGYWTGRQFIGCGPSAFSYWKGARFRNKPHLQHYWNALKDGDSPIDFTETLEPAKRQRELLAIHLRLLSGVNLHSFEKQHGPLDSALSNTIEELTLEGFLLRNDCQLYLSKKGLLFYDTVASEIV
jgi:oxygen-independent coproporphyrinogen-3 oxidase